MAVALVVRGLLEHRVRLAIRVLLSEHDAMSFSRLRQVLEETDGSLGTHLRKLENSGYLAVERSFRDRRPVTWYELTETGRSNLRRHVANLARLIDRAG
ncbi:MAG: transcriptional regulator [Gammaproteobacteria bacterium]|nr:transcriptional regulator [Gammaproteobacteria bacterium]